MESSATGRCIPHPQKSKKRVFPGRSSCMESKVEVSSPPVNRTLKRKKKMLKQNEDGMVMISSGTSSAVQHHLTDGVHSSKEVKSHKKGKGAIISSALSGAIQLDAVDGVSDSYNGKDYMDFYADDYVSEDEYAILQSNFDSIDLPTGVEASIPWFPDSIKMKNKMTSAMQDISSATGFVQSTHPDHARPSLSSVGSPNLRTQLDTASRKHKLERLPLKSSAEPAKGTQRSVGSISLSMGSPNLHNRLDTASRKHKVERLPLTSSAEPAKGTQTSVGSSSSTCLRLQRGAMKVRSVKKLLKAKSHKMSSDSGGSGSHNRHDQLGSLKVPGTLPNFPHSSNTQVGAGTSSVCQLSTVAVDPQVVDHQAIEVELNDACLGFVGTPEHGQFIPMEDVTLDQDSGKSQKSLNVAGSSSSMGQLGNNDDVPRKYQNFKKFDIVEDHSDHHYSALNSAMMQPPRNWAKKIQEEWRILKKDLPDMIFVRVYESRMDLLRAVIMGAEGTPYHDGLFFFDVCFPSNYPNVPPQVHYHSGGLRINPNLYIDGKVCLSLLNTWIGIKNEKWIPGASTMLQVLVSIQGLILNAKPYFNEPGLADSSGSVDGENQSLLYNERTLILSLKTMVYAMKKPPKHFENLVIGHFRDRAHGILMTCKAYTKGVGVGCVVDEGEERGSPRFRTDVERYMKTLAGAFKQIGVEDMEEFMSLTQNLTQKIRAFFGI